MQTSSSASVSEDQLSFPVFLNVFGGFCILLSLLVFGVTIALKAYDWFFTHETIETEASITDLMNIRPAAKAEKEDDPKPPSEEEQFWAMMGQFEMDFIEAAQVEHSKIEAKTKERELAKLNESIHEASGTRRESSSQEHGNSFYKSQLYNKFEPERQAHTAETSRSSTQGQDDLLDLLSDRSDILSRTSTPRLRTPRAATPRVSSPGLV